MNSVSELLGEYGPLASCLSNFTVRSSQQEMAESVATALDERETLIVEAGTGTGKTFAYLVPAIASGKRVIISTGTKTLQDQLFHRDLPMVRDALAAPVHITMLKGRSNYLCPQRFEQLELSGTLTSRRDRHDLQLISEWAGLTKTGDTGEVRSVAEDSTLWAKVTSTADNCLGQDCPKISSCCVVQARRAAAEADVVVINHHLLFSDMVLKEEGFGELLPGADAIIVDEAHQLPGIASDFFGASVSSRQCHDLCRDVDLALRQEAPDMLPVASRVEYLRLKLQAFRTGLGVSGVRQPWTTCARRPGVLDNLANFKQAMYELHEVLQDLAERGRLLESCSDRCETLLKRLNSFDSAVGVGQADASADGNSLGNEQVTWFETFKSGFVLRNSPLDVASMFRDCMARYPGSWVFTSATLAVGEGFEHFANRLGIADAYTALWGSPFDYQNHARLYLPKNMPEPSDANYTYAVLEAAMPVLKASQGRAFLLFTSHRALKMAANLLSAAPDFNFPLLVQGTAPRNDLLEQFRSTDNAVLLGTGSFWEGVDVRGEALSFVMIDKLPFATPDDPVFQARADALRKQGGNPFMDYQLPHAVITLKQGAGRLIRDEQDKGVLMICDPRLTTKSYGQTFLASLPAMPLVRDVEKIQKFFRGLNSKTSASHGDEQYDPGQSDRDHYESLGY